MESESLNIEDLTSFAIDVLKLSGKEALSYYGKGSSQLRFDEELVTEAELRLEAFFQDQLLKKFPEHQIFINNQVKEDYTHKEQRYLWIYDPLDGIANFQSGIPVWGNSLTLLENFWPVLAIFHMPVTGDCFYAQAGKKSFRGKRKYLYPTRKILMMKVFCSLIPDFTIVLNQHFPEKSVTWDALLPMRAMLPWAVQMQQSSKMNPIMDWPLLG